MTTPTDAGSAELVARLRMTRRVRFTVSPRDYDDPSPTELPINPDGPEAANRILALETRIRELEEALEHPPRHRFWGAGEPDCPREIKAGNGELHTLRCKVCGLDNPRDDICRAALKAQEPNP